jgi:leucyl aminopeptidase (aminopeptidase T)
MLFKKKKRIRVVTMKEILAHKNAKAVIETLMNIKENENVCIVTDTNKFDVAKILMAEALSKKAIVSLCVMKPQDYNGEEPPPPIAAAMKASDVTLSPTTKVLSHTRARLEAQKAGCRHCLMSDFTIDLLISGGLNADLKAVKKKVEKLAERMSQSEEIRITSPAGTNLTARIKGRRKNAYHGFAHEPGSYSTCQCQEANVSPIEGTTEGTLVIDAAVAGWLYIEENPIVIKIMEGFITKIEGGKEAEILREHLSNKNDKNIFNIAEIGVGLNPECRLGGGVMEDEGVFGTAHIGIGSNITLGGTVHAKGHEDLMLWEPCIELDGKIVQRGKKLFL